MLVPIIGSHGLSVGPGLGMVQRRPLSLPKARFPSPDFRVVTASTDRCRCAVMARDSAGRRLLLEWFRPMLVTET